MPIIHDFQYFKPRNLGEALQRLAEFEGRCRVLAGGTDLVCWLRDELVTPEALVDLKGLPELDRLDLAGDVLSIGARVTFTDLLDSPLIAERFPVLAEMAAGVASMAIRNRATVVGNLCSAVACCDAGPVLLALGAQMVVAGPEGEGRIPLSDWFLGNRRTALAPGQLVVRVEVPDPGRHGACYLKLGRYQGQDLCQVGVALVAQPGNVWHAAFGSVASRPFRCLDLEHLLSSGPLTAELLAQAKALALQEVAPITDIRASKEYRLLMVGVMLERGVKATAARLAGQGPAYGMSLT